MTQQYFYGDDFAKFNRSSFSIGNFKDNFVYGTLQCAEYLFVGMLVFPSGMNTKKKIIQKQIQCDFFRNLFLACKSLWVYLNWYFTDQCSLRVRSFGMVLLFNSIFSSKIKWRIWISLLNVRLENVMEPNRNVCVSFEKTKQVITLGPMWKRKRDSTPRSHIHTHTPSTDKHENPFECEDLIIKKKTTTKISTLITFF